MNSIENLGGNQPTSPIDIKHLLDVLVRRWRFLFAIPMLVLFLTYGFMKTIPPLYTSSVEILVFDPQRQVDDTVVRRVSPFDVDASAISTEITVLRSKSVALQVVKELGLDKDPEFQDGGRAAAWFGRLTSVTLDIINTGFPTSSTPGDGTTSSGEELAERNFDKAAEALRRHVEVERVGFSYVLSVSVSSKDPLKSRRLVSAIANAYLSSQREARLEALQRVASWLKKRLDELQSRIVDTESSIEKLKVASGLIDTGEKGGNVFNQQVAAINTQLMAARAEVTAAQTAYESARRVSETGDLLQIPAVMGSSIITQLHQQQLSLSRTEAELSGKVGPQHAQAASVREQLAEVKKAIRAEADHILGKMRNDYDTAVRNQQILEADLQNLATARSNSADYVKLQQLLRNLDADRKLYTNYFSQFNEITTRQTLQDIGSRVITPETFPDAPAYLKPLKVSVFAGGVGFMCTLLLIIIIEYLRTSLKTRREVETILGHPVIGLIPLITSGRHIAVGRGDPGSKRPTTEVMELDDAITAIRINLKLANSDRKPRVVLVTSAIPGEGKSATAMLLSGSNARSRQRTVLVDCDLRHQTVSEACGSNERGLSDVLIGTADIEDVIIRDRVTGTHVIPAGSGSESPADLLSGERMQSVIVELRNMYELIVIDASPLLPVVDALGLARLVDWIIVVVEWGRTPRQNVADAFKLLESANGRVAGVVLNKVDLRHVRGYNYGPRYYSALPSRRPSEKH
jgi:succinoglycan biosynthesis transport protein ExoP